MFAHHWFDFILMLIASQGCDHVVHSFLFRDDLCIVVDKARPISIFQNLKLGANLYQMASGHMGQTC